AVEIAVDEARDAVAVFDRAAPAAAGDVQRALRKAEVLLHVDEKKVQAASVARRACDAMLARPVRRRLQQESRIRPVRPARSVVRIVEERERQRLSVVHTRTT